MKPPARLSLATVDIQTAIARWGDFHRALADRTADGYPRVASGGEKAPGGARSLAMDPDSGQPVSVDLTATEAAMVARQRYVDIWRDAEALAIQLQADARRLADLVTTHATPERDARHDLPQRCCGGFGLDGGDEWGDPTCTRHAVTRAGLCDPCDQRSYRWRKRQSEVA